MSTSKRCTFYCNLSKEKNILGFSLIVNPELLAARYIANIIEFPNALSVEHFSNGRVSLMAFKVKQNSNLCQMTLSQFRKKFGNVLICAIERDNQLFIPDGEITILQNDTIYVTGNRVEVILFHNFVRPKVIKSLMLIGAVSYTHLRAHETLANLVCRLLLENS